MNIDATTPMATTAPTIRNIAMPAIAKTFLLAIPALCGLSPKAARTNPGDDGAGRRGARVSGDIDFRAGARPPTRFIERHEQIPARDLQSQADRRRRVANRSALPRR